MFWALFGEIDRLRAEEMADWLPVHLTAAGIGASELHDRLRRRVGTPLVFSSQPEDGRADGQPGLTERARTRLRARFG
ncbi:hypothetical protein AZL_b05370 (plasmid) [Azospirillum sp. B510]|uniref:hypothetical protein n=1 Tax=Azospirillum sp. (strain B510) TaxID=137722 RepID=UPI0001C4C94A|nr:hypothetical protein [Azospirillum sp. B510]BAI75200.1 hypothetical protein AZL_b05370 [Azospirillum sp. B510]